MEQELWRDIPGYEGLYQVSDQGRIINVQRQMILQPSPTPTGYLKVGLSKNGITEKRLVHTLVARVFHGDCPPRHTIDHVDFDRSNNRASNLEYVVHKESIRRAIQARGGPAVNLLKQIKTEKGWQLKPVRFSLNGKLQNDGRDGTFYIEWRENGKRKRKAVGKNPTDAVTARDRLAHRLHGETIGLKTPPTSEPSDKTLARAIEEFLEEKRLSRKKKTHADHATALEYFQEFCTKARLADITRKDLVGFAAWLRDEKKLSRRTVYNKFARIVSFLKHFGIEKLALKGDWPTFVEQPPDIYEVDELNNFFAACSEDENVYFHFFLMSGMREQEVMHLCWSDVKLDAAVVFVREHPEYGWYPKAYKGREIPIPQKLVDMLREWKKKRDTNCPLVFPTSGCRPKMDFLDICKRIATTAKIENAYLHKFRATFATRHLQNGVDIRTVQAWMGHDDLASTMRYLRPARGEEVQDKVNSTFA